jgi:hypothetical protein
MSNRLRQRLPDHVRAKVRRAIACPDCRATVQVRADGWSRVRHDDGCPAHGALREQGRTVQVALVPRPDVDVRALAAAVGGRVGTLGSAFYNNLYDPDRGAA